MPSIPRTRTSFKVDSKFDGIVDLSDYRYDHITNMFVKVPIGSTSTIGNYEQKYCSDFNNRSNSDFHVLRSKTKGYLDGKLFFLRTTSGSASRVKIPELTSLGQGPHSVSPSVEGEAMSTYAYSVDIDAWTDDDGNYHNPSGWDVYHFILPFLNRARRDLRPDLPKFSLFRELVELRDVKGLVLETKQQLSELIKRTFRVSGRKAANNYLAYQFGFLPIIKSVKDFLDLYQNINKYIQQLIRDDGRQVRRRKTYVGAEKSNPALKGVTSWTRDITDSNNLLPSYLLMGNVESSATMTVTEELRCWAVGTYQYHLPAGPRDLKWATKLAKKLAGFYPTPSQLYQLVPWTWLFDWFTSTGTWLESMDGGVAENGAYSSFHMMAQRRLTIDTVLRVRLSQKQSGEPFEFELPQRTVIIYKFRFPFGPFDAPFAENFDLDQMNDFQKSILSAIGIQKFGSVLDRTRRFN